MGCLVLVLVPDDLPLPEGLGLSEPKPASNADFTVVIDAGHGGRDEGAKCRGVLEKKLTLDIALRLERLLRERGYRTVLTRSDDRYLSLAERAAIANAARDPALFVSIHFNQGSGRDINGIETFYALHKTPPPADWTWVGLFSRSGELDHGEDLAAAVQGAVVEKTGARNRGIRARDLYVTRNTRIPAILTEGGFITNTMEAHLLQQEVYANRLAEGIADGLGTWQSAHPQRVPGSLPAPQPGSFWAWLHGLGDGNRFQK
jgi:N-acetylmuramoyl-L-alanine amidase